MLDLEHFSCRNWTVVVLLSSVVAGALVPLAISATPHALSATSVIGVPPTVVAPFQVYGFYDECQRKYGNDNAWRYCTDVL